MRELRDGRVAVVDREGPRAFRAALLGPEGAEWAARGYPTCRAAERGAEQAAAAAVLLPNPRASADEDFAEGLAYVLSKGRPFSIALDHQARPPWPSLYVVPTTRARPLFAVVDPAERIIGLADPDFLFDPTTVHALREVLAAIPGAFDGYELREFMTTWGSGRLEFGAPTGYTAERFCREVHRVREESVLRSPFDDTETPVTFTYWALRGPQEVRWFHATLEASVPSILERGLLPSGLGEGRAEGWSPGWNMHLQRGVYLTSDEGYAAGIAETLAMRAEANAVILAVDGAGLEDTRQITYDEDALRSELDDSILPHFDPDFPQWVTSQEHRVRSIAYLGSIAPRFVSVLATVRFEVEEEEDRYGEVRRIPELVWDDDDED